MSNESRAHDAAIRAAEDLVIMEEAEVIEAFDECCDALRAYAVAMLSRGMRPSSALSQLSAASQAVWFDVVGLSETPRVR
jgi:hypothetical protein